MQIAQTKWIVFISRFKLDFWINIVFNMEFLVLRRVPIRRAQHQAQVEVLTTIHRRQVTMILNTTPHECRKYHPHHARKSSAKCQQINQINVTFFSLFLTVRQVARRHSSQSHTIGSTLTRRATFHREPRQYTNLIRLRLTMRDASPHRTRRVDPSTPRQWRPLLASLSTCQVPILALELTR